MLALFKTLGIAIPGVLLLNAAWLLPSLTGYRAQYETLDQIFSLIQLSTRSLDLYPSLLGFGREIGYFGFTGTETWYSYPGLPLWAYYAFATFIPVLAYTALRWHRDRRTVFLALVAIIATLAAPGSRAPLGSAYLWAVRHVPIFGNLRDPNRWLIVQAIAYAILAGLSVSFLASAVASRRMSAQRSQRVDRQMAFRLMVAFMVVAVGLVPVMPTLIIGLRTWHLTPPQAALLDRAENAPAQTRIASIPFGQDYRYLMQGHYRGYEHDLGYESALFTGHPDVGDGSWTQRSANFVAFEANLLARRDPAFAAMLASVGVSRVTSFNYPLVASQLLNGDVGPYSQQRSARRLAHLKKLMTNRAGTDYAVNDPAAPMSFRRNVALILGGSEGIAALADQPGVSLSDWAAFTADDVIASQGYSALLHLIRTANVVLFANERPADIAVQGVGSLVRVAGITSDPQLDRLQTDVPTDQSAQFGSLVDPAFAIPQPSSTASSSGFSVSSAQRVQLWARVLANSRAAKIEIRVDGRLVGSVTPLTLGTGGFEWLRLATVEVGRGHHHVTISASPSTYGNTYEVQEARVLMPVALHSAERELRNALRANAPRVAYSFNLADVAKWSWRTLADRLGKTRVRAYSLHRWVVPGGSGSSVRSTAAPGGYTAPQFTAYGGRAVYAVAKISYGRPVNWAGRPYVYLRFRGTGSGHSYTVVFEFANRTSSDARYVFSDDSTGWRTIAFPTASPAPGSGPTDWGRVRSVLIALPSKSDSGTFAVGIPRASRRIRSITVRLPIIQGTTSLTRHVPQPRCVGRGSVRNPRLNQSLHLMDLPVASLSQSCRIYLSAKSRARQWPAVPVQIHRKGQESWLYSLSAHQPGVLVWTQAFDPLWKLSGDGERNEPLPVQSLLDGYFVAAGHHVGIVAFADGSLTTEAVAITLAAGLALMAIAIAGWYLTRPVRSARHAAVKWSQGGDLPVVEPPLRRIPRICLNIGVLMLACCPIASLKRWPSAILPLSSGALLAFAISAILIAASRVHSALIARKPEPDLERVMDASIR